MLCFEKEEGLVVPSFAQPLMAGLLSFVILELGWVCSGVGLGRGACLLIVTMDCGKFEQMMVV